MGKIEADYSTRAGCSLMIYKTGVQWCSVSDVPRGTILCFMIFMRVRRLLTAGTGLVPQYIINSCFLINAGFYYAGKKDTDR